MTPDAVDRLERQLADLTAAVQKLVLIEERQKQDWKRMDAVDKRLHAVENQANATDRLLQQWINRGIGAWAIAATVAAGLKWVLH